MGVSTEVPVLRLLERAEVAARGRRLAASTEADRIVTSGRDRASAITSGADARVADALDGLREQADSDAERAIEALEREAADQARVRARSPQDDPAFEQAVELVVALILGERGAGVEQGDGS